MKIVCFPFFIIFFTGCQQPQKDARHIELYGSFEGTEPFWSLEIKKNNYEFTGAGKTIKGNAAFSKKSERGVSYAFKDGELFGVINKSATGLCDYAITEDSAAYEIFLSFKGVTYQGCGNLEVK
jgi:uncharacterized membrane protein